MTNKPDISTADTEEIPIVQPESEHRTGVWWWVNRIVTFTLLAVMLLALAVTIVIPRLTGSTPYTVLTSSMKPSYPPGSLVVIKPADADELQVGTAVLYQIRSGEPDVITHRIVATRQSGGGETTYITRGDNNGSDDAEPVKIDQIRGKVWYSVPYMGYVNNLLNGEQRRITLIVIVVGLAGYALYMFVGAGNDYRKRRKESQAP